MTSNYQITPNGDTRITDFNNTKPFSSFFPGIAGPFGTPLWAFYVNRGQCVTAFGIESKDKSILEFYPANRAYINTSTLGFRTFLKVKKKNIVTFYEPFQNNLENLSFKCQNNMSFGPAHLTLTETNEALGLKVVVTYQTIPNTEYAALSRRLEVYNLSKTDLEYEVIDGLPLINAYGTDSWLQKHMSRTGEAWVVVKYLENNTPLYKLKVEIADKPETEYIHQGNFSFYWDSNGILPALIDPVSIFGNTTSFNIPSAFIETDTYELPTKQTFENFSPCAMSYKKGHIKAGSKDSIYGCFGHVSKEESLKSITHNIKNKKNWFEIKERENSELLESILNNMSTFSSHQAFDLYSSHTFLDNILRGGLPVSLPGKDATPHICHLYSRKHGDLERDYNHFSLQPSFFSQGNGNFRDVNQNRRNDTWFNVDLSRTNIRTFFNLLQLDGHNPLVIKSALFQYISNKSNDNELKQQFSDKDWDIFSNKLKQPFAPGPLLSWIRDQELSIKNNEKELLSTILPMCYRVEEADHNEGFWSDHWTYNLDLIESYLKVYPDKKDDLLFKDSSYSYYQSIAYINPRRKRYILRNNKPFQTNNVHETEEKPQSALDTLVKTKNGNADVYYTTLSSKIFTLILNKMATLDPSGVGIEMEGGRPNWYDALNGLPGLFGSSINETLELKRIIQFMINTFDKSCNQNIKVPVEVETFFNQLNTVLKTTIDSDDSFTYWDKSTTYKEEYREKIQLGIEGQEEEIQAETILSFLRLSIDKINQGIKKAIDPVSGVVNSYFINELKEYDVKKDNENNEIIIPKAFNQRPAALFLEGPMHLLKVDKENAKSNYDAVKNSDLFDKKLKMYKVNASLKDMPTELGRCTIFTPGWLENESIWMHMEYKYLLETLRSELYDDFFHDFKNALIPFQDPDTYGRSILENSSFIASSANSNENNHGNGFVARLSGSTAEFIHIWLHLNMGSKPFSLDESGKLTFKPRPILPGWLFNDSEREISFISKEKPQKTTLPKCHYSFILFGTTLVTYINPSKKNTFGEDSVNVTSFEIYKNENEFKKFDTNFLSSELASEVREGSVYKINIYLQ